MQFNLDDKARGNGLMEKVWNISWLEGLVEMLPPREFTPVVCLIMEGSSMQVPFVNNALAIKENSISARESLFF